MDRRSREILDRYRVPADRSPDLLAMKASLAVDVTTEVTTDEPPATPASTAPE